MSATEQLSLFVAEPQRELDPSRTIAARRVNHNVEILDDQALLLDYSFEWTDPEWTAREVTQFTAEQWVAKYHYLGKTPASAIARVGIFCPDMISIVVYAQATNAHGVAKKFDLEELPGNIEIARVATHPGAIRNTTSRAIALANKFFHEQSRLEWLFSYADTGQGHHGGIYQALNSLYVGVSETRPGFLVDGEPIHPRTVVAWLGTQAREEAIRRAKAAGHELEYVEGLNTRKHTYILPIGDARSRRKVKAAVQRFVQPYPKREPEPYDPATAEIPF